MEKPKSQEKKSRRLWCLKSPSGRLVWKTVGETETKTIDLAIAYFSSIATTRDWVKSDFVSTNKSFIKACASKGWSIVPVRLEEITDPKEAVVCSD